MEFEPTISAGERPQTYALDRAATGTGLGEYYTIYLMSITMVYVTWRTGVVYVLVQQPPVGQGLLMHDVSRSHTMTHHSR